MIKMDKILEHKNSEIEEMIKILEERLKDSPAGSLRISRGQYGCRYYQCFSEKEWDIYVKNTDKCKNAINSYEKYMDTNGIYISREKKELAMGLAQKTYDNQVLKWLKIVQKQLLRLVQCFRDDMLDDFYEKLPDERKELVVPINQPMRNIIKQWIEIPFEGKQFREDDIHIVTDKGERVRSKSEKILADKFFRWEIPYKYECPLKLEGYGIIFPDFTLMNPQNGKIYYWEHLGMMDDADYARAAIKKIECYEKNKIFPGKQLILTYETQKGELQIGIVEKLLWEYFGQNDTEI